MQVRGKRRRGGHHQEDVKHAGAGKEKKVRPNKRWLDTIRDDTKECNMTKCVTHEDKGRPITTCRRPIVEKVRSVWHMKTKVGPLLHVGGL